MQLQNFINVFSEERISTYLKLTNDQSKTIDLYEANLEISSSFYISLHSLELVLRNKIHNQLAVAFGEEWLFSIKVLSPKQIQIASEVKDKIKRDGKNPIIPRIIAGLSFSFWEHLFSQKYEELWIRHLHKIFGKPPKKFTRKEWHKKLTPIRKLRNRMAHYECILNYNILESYNDIIKCISYLDEEVAIWTDKVSETKEILKDKENLLTSII